MRLLAFAPVLTLLLIAASAPAQPQRQPLDDALKQARAEQAAAEAATAELERVRGRSA